MFLRLALTALVAAQAALSVPLEERKVDFNWGGEKIRGINVGGWLVLEPWITPSIFQKVDQSLKIVDEYTLGKKLPKSAPGILKKHWDTWCTFSDFQKIASSGFNVVRIPIGFWAYDNANTPYVKGAAPYLDKAIGWARTTNPPLKVIIDLHGAPGSQNGYDNSGERLPVSQIGWLKGGAGGPTAQRTLKILQTISSKYAKPSYQDVVAGIELLNEPFSPALSVPDIYTFYRQGFKNTRKTSDTTVVLHDAFRQPDEWNGFLTPSDGNAQNVAVDHHEYQVFSDGDIAMVPWQHRQAVCNRAGAYSDADKWTFVGEWSAAMTDCAPALNGYRIGARYDGTYPGSTKVGSCGMYNNVKNWPQWYKDDTRGYIEAQMEAFEQRTQGWCFWNFKTEAAHEWDAFALIDAGVFPQPLTARKYGAICDNL
ncbi:putative Exo-beta-1,3-glucanase [Rhizodiscina lignyota]|uniref:glucan 1,3-beta-glucosidase n=1 Tax=Rhizodiscina lignyota TaxID=1504668 RepID=A0A9P4IKN2_9PEZI|nr:putative Exo-beta-1,3-glucanase [Rhizodiscina lignyota]